MKKYLVKVVNGCYTCNFGQIYTMGEDGKKICCRKLVGEPEVCRGADYEDLRDAGMSPDCPLPDLKIEGDIDDVRIY